MKSISAYQDEKKILDAALASGGGTLQFETPGQAIHFRQRVYTLRKILRENASPAMSPFDRLTIPSLKKGQTEVRIEVSKIKAEFVPDPTGQPVVPDMAEVPEDDPLLVEALKIAGDIL